jgi:hypothetical protein
MVSRTSRYSNIYRSYVTKSCPLTVTGLVPRLLSLLGFLLFRLDQPKAYPFPWKCKEIEGYRPSNLLRIEGSIILEASSKRETEMTEEWSWKLSLEVLGLGLHLSASSQEALVVRAQTLLVLVVREQTFGQPPPPTVLLLAFSDLR